MTDVEQFLAGAPEGQGALNEKMGVRILEASAERVVGTMPVKGNTQPYGLLHGGASVVLAETLGSIGSAIHGAPERLSVGVDINATHHRSAREGIVTELSVRIRKGPDAVWEGQAQSLTDTTAPGADANSIAQRLASALFSGFPGESGRTIEVK